MSEQPLVSVVMNCYNGEKYLKEAIDSVRAQTYQNWQIIFWDNQSTDRSAEVFKGYDDPRLRYFYADRHTSLYEARNYAVERANGTLIAFLDVDDWWLSDKLEKQVVLFEDPEIGFVYGNYWIVSERKARRWKARRAPAPTGWVLDDLLESYFIGLLTLVIRRSALATLDSGFDARYNIIGDLDLMVRLSVRWKGACVHTPVAFYRLHDGSETTRDPSRQLVELESWWADIKEIEAIRSSPSFHLARARITYLTGMYHVMGSDRREAFRLFRDLPWGSLKSRLALALCLPTFAVSKLKR